MNTLQSVVIAFKSWVENIEGKHYPLDQGIGRRIILQ